ncbi:MAG: alcohol dehydrogenase catalytic domain-containing protein [Rhodospirillales bacterium]|nr:alcohol dehydrogenase catalytic domain-containing protein [Rhodospirillales bacterium]
MISYDVAECGCPLKLFERPTPTPQGTEVLLRVLAAGVCHSDIHFWDGVYDMGGGKQLKLTERGITLPLTMGHESVGEVIALGPDARGVKIGDRRLVYPWIGCGQCPVCTRGEENLCTKPKFIGVHRPGGYSDHLIVPHARYLMEIGSLSPEEAAPLACSGVTTFSALKKVEATLKTEPTLIIGAGGLGLMCLSLMKAMGAKGAIVADIDPAKREAATKAGALATVDAKSPDAVKQVMEAAGGPIWAAIDLVGAESSARLGIDSLVKGGKLVIVGLYGGAVTISTPLFPMKAMTIQGSYVGSPSELQELLNLVQKARPPRIPMTIRPLREANAAITDLKAGRQIGRAILVP